MAKVQSGLSQKSKQILADMKTTKETQWKSMKEFRFISRTKMMNNANNIITRNIGQFSIEQRAKDGMLNATALLKQWNKVKKESKSTSEFLSGQKAFDEWFLGKHNPIGIAEEDGILWLDENKFRCFLCYLSAELFLVEYPKTIQS